MVVKVFRKETHKSGALEGHTITSWEKSFSTLEEAEAYANRQKQLLTEWEGLLYSEERGFYSPFCTPDEGIETRLVVECVL